MRVAKWGNSLAVRLPKKVIDRLALKEGDDVQFGVAEGASPVFEVQKKRTREEIIDSLKQFEGLLPADFKFDRDEAAGLTRLRGYRSEDSE